MLAIEKINGTKLNVCGEVVEMKLHQYGNGRPAIQLIDQIGCPFGMLTVNIPDIELEENEFCVKDWSENEVLVGAVMEQTDLFEDTGRAVKMGFVMAPIWRLK